MIEKSQIIANLTKSVILLRISSEIQMRKPPAERVVSMSNCRVRVSSPNGVRGDSPRGGELFAGQRGRGVRRSPCNIAPSPVRKHQKTDFLDKLKGGA